MADKSVPWKLVHESAAGILSQVFEVESKSLDIENISSLDLN